MKQLHLFIMTRSMQEYCCGVNGWDGVKEDTVFEGEEFKEFISSISVFNASSTCLLRSLRRWVRLNRLNVSRKNVTLIHILLKMETSLERANFDYCWNVMNSDRVESGEMGARSKDRTDLMTFNRLIRVCTDIERKESAMSAEQREHGWNHWTLKPILKHIET